MSQTRKQGGKSGWKKKEDAQATHDHFHDLDSLSRLKSDFLSKVSGLENLDFNCNESEEGSSDSDSSAVDNGRPPTGGACPKLIISDEEMLKRMQDSVKDAPPLTKMKGLDELLGKNPDPILARLVDEYRRDHPSLTLGDMKNVIDGLASLEAVRKSNFNLVQYDDGDQSPLKGQEGQAIMAQFGEY